MQSVSPVFTEELVPQERNFAENQPEYIPVIGLPTTLRIIDPKDPNHVRDIVDGAVSIRFRLSPEERAQVAAGLDLVVTQLTFGKPLSPMNLQLCPAKTQPIFGTEEPAALAQGDGDPSAADLDAFTEAQRELEKNKLYTMPLSDICPSCGATERARESQQKSVSANACANCWHTNHAEQPAAKEDQPQSEV